MEIIQKKIRKETQVNIKINLIIGSYMSYNLYDNKQKHIDSITTDSTLDFLNIDKGSNDSSTKLVGLDNLGNTCYM